VKLQKKETTERGIEDVGVPLYQGIVYKLYAANVFTGFNRVLEKGKKSHYIRHALLGHSPPAVCLSIQEGKTRGFVPRWKKKTRERWGFDGGTTLK